MAALAEEAGVSEGENKSDFNEVVKLVWGETVNEDLLRRWSQGFVFSVEEPSALVQEQGGPCAVIASVQAYLIKNMLFSEEKSTELENWRQLAGDQAQDFLVLALLEILKLSKSKQYILVILRDHLTPVPEMVSDQESDESIGQCSADSNTPMSESGKTAEYHKKVCSQELRSFTSDSFHASLSQVCCPGDDDLTKMIKKNLQLFEGQFGVLLFLYSVILTKGIQNIKLETEDPEDQLVDQNFGHGSQALTNLMLTGHAVSNVWDLNRDVSGYELKGIPEQSSLGYLTLLEALRYCEVGSFLKSPKCPIWLLGSETHITVFFTMDRTLSRSENPRDKAIRVFKTYDKQENGFVESDKLTNILQELELETDPAYVTFMRSRLDTDQIGIILLPNFLEEFFPGQNYYQDVKPFKVYHYNGLGSSSTEQVRKVVYTEGLASVEWTDIQSVTEEPIITCLRTKWPGITIDWKVTNAPSLN